MSFTDSERTRHAVEVEARSLYEAAALALGEFRSSGVIEEIGPGTRLSIAVRRPETIHELTVGKVEAWLSASGKSPAEQALKHRLREKHG